jgi:hypothetical protein
MSVGPGSLTMCCGAWDGHRTAVGAIAEIWHSGIGRISDLYLTDSARTHFDCGTAPPTEALP